MTRIWTSWIDV